MFPVSYYDLNLLQNPEPNEREIKEKRDTNSLDRK